MSDIWNDPSPVHYDDGKRFGTASEMIAEIRRLRESLAWLLYHIDGRALRHLVGVLNDTSDLNEFISAIERARSA